MPSVVGQVPRNEYSRRRRSGGEPGSLPGSWSTALGRSLPLRKKLGSHLAFLVPGGGAAAVVETTLPFAKITFQDGLMAQPGTVAAVVRKCGKAYDSYSRRRNV